MTDWTRMLAEAAANRQAWLEHYLPPQPRFTPIGEAARLDEAEGARALAPAATEYPR